MAFAWLRRGLGSRMPQSDGYSPLSITSDGPSSSFNEKTSPARSRAWWVSCLICLLPSFVQPSDGGGVSPGRRKSPSAWLDGLRGIAAFIVVWHHSSLVYFPWSIHHAWTGADASTSLFIQLPVVRLLIAGAPGVCIFFVISGYAISLKLLRLSHLARPSDFVDSLASSLFRRHPRLFMPAAAVTLLTALMAYLGLFPAEAWSEHVAIATRVPPLEPTLWLQLLDWARRTWSLAYPIRNTINSRDVNPYDPNLWTLPVEFGCSILVFTLLAVTYRFRPLLRMAFVLVLAAYCLARAEQNVFLFLCGLFLADVRTNLTLREEARGEAAAGAPPHLLPMAAAAPPAERRRTLFRSRWPKRAAFALACLACLYVLGMPEQNRGGADAPGFATLTSLIPQAYHDARRADYFWVPLAAALLVATLDHAPFLQRAFTTRLAQYLGTISFSIYLVHGPLLWSYGAWLAPRLIPQGDDVTPGRHAFGVALCYLCFWPVVIYEADLVTRIVDARSVVFARWVYNKLVRS